MFDVHTLIYKINQLALKIHPIHKVKFIIAFYLSNIFIQNEKRLTKENFIVFPKSAKLKNKNRYENGFIIKKNDKKYCKFFFTHWVKKKQA